MSNMKRKVRMDFEREDGRVKKKRKEWRKGRRESVKRKNSR